MENIKIENLFIVGYGLAGGFGGIRDYEVIEADNLEEAEKIAYELACEEYERYVGLYGLREIEQIMEEDEIEDYDEAELIYNEERESWLDYKAMSYNKDNEEKVKYHHYNNPYKSVTDI